jgi:hypothetical protein
MQLKYDEHVIVMSQTINVNNAISYRVLLVMASVPDQQMARLGVVQRYPENLISPLHFNFMYRWMWKNVCFR